MGGWEVGWLGERLVGLLDGWLVGWLHFIQPPIILEKITRRTPLETKNHYPFEELVRYHLF